jgi:hypothetical protein
MVVAGLAVNYPYVARPSHALTRHAEGLLVSGYSPTLSLLCTKRSSPTHVVSTLVDSKKCHTFTYLKYCQQTLE